MVPYYVLAPTFGENLNRGSVGQAESGRQYRYDGSDTYQDESVGSRADLTGEQVFSSMYASESASDTNSGVGSGSGHESAATSALATPPHSSESFTLEPSDSASVAGGESVGGSFGDVVSLAETPSTTTGSRSLSLSNQSLGSSPSVSSASSGQVTPVSQEKKFPSRHAASKPIANSRHRSFTGESASSSVAPSTPTRSTSSRTVSKASSEAGTSTAAAPKTVTTLSDAAPESNLVKPDFAPVNNTKKTERFLKRNTAAVPSLEPVDKIVMPTRYDALRLEGEDELEEEKFDDRADDHERHGHGAKEDEFETSSRDHESDDTAANSEQGEEDSTDSDDWGLTPYQEYQNERKQRFSQSLRSLPRRLCGGVSSVCTNSLAAVNSIPTLATTSLPHFLYNEVVQAFLIQTLYHTLILNVLYRSLIYAYLIAPCERRYTALSWTYEDSDPEELALAIHEKLKKFFRVLGLVVFFYLLYQKTGLPLASTCWIGWYMLPQRPDYSKKWVVKEEKRDKKKQEKFEKKVKERGWDQRAAVLLEKMGVSGIDVPFSSKEAISKTGAAAGAGGGSGGGNGGEQGGPGKAKVGEKLAAVTLKGKSTSAGGGQAGRRVKKTK